MEVILFVLALGAIFCAIVFAAAMIIALLVTIYNFIFHRKWRFAYYTGKALRIALKVCGFILYTFALGGASSAGSSSSKSNSGKSASSSSRFSGGTSRGGGTARSF